MSNRNILQNGVADLLILHLLTQKDCYGYEIAQNISGLSDGLLVISQNTIYTAIYKLENVKMISEYSKLIGRKRTRVYYHIEPQGRQYMDDLQSSFESTIQGIRLVMEKSIQKGEGVENEQAESEVVSEISKGNKEPFPFAAKAGEALS